MQTVTVKKNIVLRHVLFFVILAAAFGIAVISKGIKTEVTEIKMYFVDAEMMRLIPVRTSIPEMSAERTAKRALELLIEGHDDNPKIRRIIPDKKNCMTVKVKNEIAIVDIKKEMLEERLEGRDIELLAVYSIVNTLTGIDGITNVKFTIEGKTQRDFMGYLDMRETFIPDYFV